MANFRGVAYSKLHAEIASEDAKRAVVREAKKGPSERCHGRKLGPVSCFTETFGRGCPLSEVILYGQRSFWGKRLVRCPEVRGCPYLGGCKYTTHMEVAVCATACVRCTEVVRISECPLIEVLL